MLHLTSKLEMSGVITLLPRTFPKSVKVTLAFTFTFTFRRIKL